MTEIVKKPRAVFLDRDGTLNKEISRYVSDPDDLEIFPCAPVALKKLSDKGFLLVLVSNQSGVGKGIMNHSQLHAVEQKLRNDLREGGAELAGAYYCTHVDEDNCSCRKPKGGLVIKAAQELGIDIAKSYMIGDAWRDMAAGRSAGVKTVFVPTGINPEAQSPRVFADKNADYVAVDLMDAVNWILGDSDDLEDA